MQFIKNSSFQSPRRKFAQTKVQAISEVNAVISTSNFAFLALGRFVFLPYQRRQLAKAGLPRQNDETHAAAGDRLAQEASFVLASNDPEGFTAIDVLAYGTLGHAVGFIILALTSNSI